MIAEIGGYVGLLLGVSLFKIADINNVFIDWCTRNEADESDESEKNKKKKRISHVPVVVNPQRTFHM